MENIILGWVVLGIFWLSVVFCTFLVVSHTYYFIAYYFYLKARKKTYQKICALSEQ